MKKIIWEAHVDPMNANIDSFPSLIMDHYEGKDGEEEDGDEEEGYNDGYSQMLPPLFKPKIAGLIHTKFDLLTVMDHTSACNAFDMWIMHTNFNITEREAVLIDNCPGVETLEVLTRYRCKIGFPNSNLFDNTEVKKNIEGLLLEIEEKDEIERLKHDLNTRSARWIMYVAPDNNIFTAIDDSVISKSVLFNDLHRRLGGTILTSDEN